MAFMTVDHADIVIIYNNYPVFAWSFEFSLDDLNIDGYFSNNPRRERDERSDFHRRLANYRSIVEKLEPK